MLFEPGAVRAFVRFYASVQSGGGTGVQGGPSSGECHSHILVSQLDTDIPSFCSKKAKVCLCSAVHTGPRLQSYLLTRCIRLYATNARDAAKHDND